MRADLTTLPCPSSSHPPRPRSQRPPSPGPLLQAPAVFRFLPSPQASILTRGGQVSHCSAGWPRSMTLMLTKQKPALLSWDSFALRCDEGYSFSLKDPIIIEGAPWRNLWGVPASAGLGHWPVLPHSLQVSLLLLGWQIKELQAK